MHDLSCQLNARGSYHDKAMKEGLRPFFNFSTAQCVPILLAWSVMTNLGAILPRRHFYVPGKAYPICGESFILRPGSIVLLPMSHDHTYATSASFNGCPG